MTTPSPHFTRQNYLIESGQGAFWENLDNLQANDPLTYDNLNFILDILAATPTQEGTVTTAAQTFAANKTFKQPLEIEDTAGTSQWYFGHTGSTGQLSCTGGVNCTSAWASKDQVGFTNYCPTSTVAPTIANHLCRKSYVDARWLPLILEQRESSGDDAGDAVSGSYFQRILNTSTGDTSLLVSLTANRFTIGEGTWRIQGSVPAHRVDQHKCQLYNYSDSTVTLLGTAAKTDSEQDFGNVCSFLNGVFTIASNKTFEIRQRVDETRNGDGCGDAAGFGDQEIYTQMLLWKLS